MGPNREVHLAFAAADHDAVPVPSSRRRVRRRVAARAAAWPEYHPGYFGAFVRDPDGNNVKAVCHA